MVRIASLLRCAMKKIVLYYISIFTLCFLSCDDTRNPEFEEPPHATVSIARLKELCRSSCMVITDDISITAYVIANDMYGEYYKSIIIADESGCIEVAVDCTSTSKIFPRSAKITIYCTGLCLGRSGGKIILGASPTSHYTVDRIPKGLFSKYFAIDDTHPCEIEPLELSIAELDTHHIGNHVAINEVTFGDDAGLAWCDIDPQTGDYVATTRHAYDKAGNSIDIYTMAQCHYRDEPIPAGWGSIWGIVEYFNNSYSLRIINHNIIF